MNEKRRLKEIEKTFELLRTGRKRLIIMEIGDLFKERNRILYNGG
jgi:hypothetical protein